MREQTASTQGTVGEFARLLSEPRGHWNCLIVRQSDLAESPRPRLRALHASCEKELSTARGSKGAKEKEIDFVCSSSQCSVRRCRFSSGASGFRALW